MPFVKVVKTKSYFKRFQVKFKRRREGKTDYAARRALVIQDKNKYNAPKYRLVVRITNSDIVVQVVYATLNCDRVLSAAYAHELKQERFGVKAGVHNYAGAYATGLLAARRVLKKLNLDAVYTGNTKTDGTYYLVKEVEGQRRPFLVLLDVGLARTSTGAKTFAVLKGAVDGGLEIPHKPKRFAGYNSETRKFDPKILRKYIFGGHVADYMKLLQADDPEKYQSQFALYLKSQLAPDDIEKMWTACHAAIRKDPTHVPSKKPEKPNHKTHHQLKKNLKQRQNRIAQKKAAVEKVGVPAH
jgi:large subunit ribosomal protein L5e